MKITEKSATLILIVVVLFCFGSIIYGIEFSDKAKFNEMRSRGYHWCSKECLDLGHRSYTYKHPKCYCNLNDDKVIPAGTYGEYDDYAE